MTATPTLKPNVDNRLRAGAIAFGLVALMHVPSLFSVQPPDVLLLLDQIFAEPGWIPVFLGGFVYFIGLFVMSIAVWRSADLTPSRPARTPPRRCSQRRPCSRQDL
jgi:hypothetical protein